MVSACLTAASTKSSQGDLAHMMETGKVRPGMKKMGTLREGERGERGYSRERERGGITEDSICPCPHARNKEGVTGDEEDGDTEKGERAGRRTTHALPCYSAYLPKKVENFSALSVADVTMSLKSLLRAATFLSTPNNTSVLSDRSCASSMMMALAAGGTTQGKWWRVRRRRVEERRR